MKWIFVGLFVFAPAAFALADEVSEACLVCHKDALSLKGKDTSAVTGRIKDMRDGRAQHPGPMPKLTDAEIEALARALTGLG